MSQLQVLSLLSQRPATKADVTNASGMTIEGARKAVEYLVRTGDIEALATKTVKGRSIRIYSLTGQGRAMISGICPPGE